MDPRAFFRRVRRGPLHSGAAFETQVAHRLSVLAYRGHTFHVQPTAAAGHGIDIPTTWNETLVGWEAKRANAFEAGGRKMEIVDGRLVVHEEGLVKQLLGELPVFGGEIPRFLTERVTEWSPEEAARFKDQRHPIDPNAAAAYYAAKDTHYIIVEGRGVYHTGVDILGLGVPKFVCEMTLRIRTSKHKTHILPDGTRVPTDVVVDLNYKPRTLPTTPVCLFTSFPGE
jgi:hypothetical protein